MACPCQHKAEPGAPFADSLSATAFPCRNAPFSVGPLRHPPLSGQLQILTTSPTTVLPKGVRAEEGSDSRGGRGSPLVQVDLAADARSVGGACDRVGAELGTPG